MVGGRTAPAGEIQQFIITRHRRAGQYLAGEVARHRRCGHQTACQFERGQQHPLIPWVGQIVGLDQRRIRRVGRAQANVATAFRALLARAATHAGEIIQRIGTTLLVAAGREQHLDIAALQLRPRFPVHMDQRRAERDDAGPPGQPARDFHAESPTARAFIERDRVARARNHAHGEVVAQVLAHPGQVLQHLDAELPQLLRRPDAGQLQQLRRVEGACTDDHFAAGAHLAARAALIEAHADRAPVFEQDAGGLRRDAQVDAAAPDRRMQKRSGATDPPTFENIALEIARALLARAVVVRVARNAEFTRSGDKGFAQRRGPVRIGDRQRTAAAAQAIVARADPAFRTHEVRQHVGVAPALVAGRRPVIEIIRLAAAVDQPVERTRAADHAPLHDPDFTACGRGVRRAAELPQKSRVVEQLDEAGGNPHVAAGVGGAGFEHTYGRLPVRAQTLGQQRSGRTRAHHHVVINVGHRAHNGIVASSLLCMRQAAAACGADNHPCLN